LNHEAVEATLREWAPNAHDTDRSQKWRNDSRDSHNSFCASEHIDVPAPMTDLLLLNRSISRFYRTRNPCAWRGGSVVLPCAVRTG
jgi:hypothetical protein